MNKLSISVKCSDMFMANGIIDGKYVNYDGYVPESFGNDGDYLTLTINLDTMEIIEFGGDNVAFGIILNGATKKEIIEELNE